MKFSSKSVKDGKELLLPQDGGSDPVMGTLGNHSWDKEGKPCAHDAGNMPAGMTSLSTPSATATLWEQNAYHNRVSAHYM